MELTTPKALIESEIKKRLLLIDNLAVEINPADEVNTKIAQTAVAKVSFQDSEIVSNRAVNIVSLATSTFQVLVKFKDVRSHLPGLILSEQIGVRLHNFYAINNMTVPLKVVTESFERVEDKIWQYETLVNCTYRYGEGIDYTPCNELPDLPEGVEWTLHLNLWRSKIGSTGITEDSRLDRHYEIDLN